MKDGYEKIKEKLHYQKLLFVPVAIQIKLISWYYNNILIGYFGIDKIKEPIGRKYY